MVKSIMEPVVRVEDASGLFVYSEEGVNLVVTNAHVIDELMGDEFNLAEANFATVDRFDYDERGEILGFYQVQADVVAYNKNHDLAMLKLHDKRKYDCVAALVEQNYHKRAKLFDEVILVGCALSDMPVPSKGIISSLSSEIERQMHWMSTAPIVMGNSGGGCFVKDGGEYKLAGLARAIVALLDEDGDEDHPKETYSHLNYIIPPQTTIPFIQSVISKLKKSDD